MLTKNFNRTMTLSGKKIIGIESPDQESVSHLSMWQHQTTDQILSNIYTKSRKRSALPCLGFL